MDEVFEYSIFFEYDDETYLVRAINEADALTKLFTEFIDTKVKKFFDSEVSTEFATNVAWHMKDYTIKMELQFDIETFCEMFSCRITKLEKARDVIKVS